MLGARRLTAPERAVIEAARISGGLPRFRGKNRLALKLLELAGLTRKHTLVEAELRRPTPFHAQLDLHSWLQRLAFVSGGYEEDTVRFLRRLSESSPRPGWFLDVGANVGLIAIPYAMLEGADATRPAVYALEAVADNHRALVANVERNSLGSSIATLCVAVGDEEKSVDIQVEGNLAEGEGTGTANILADSSGYECVRIPLKLETLDGLMDRGALRPGCSLVKIDTDGYDLKVLMGGTRFLAGNRPVVFGEFLSTCMAWHSQSVSDVLAFCRERGYLAWQKESPDSWSFTKDVDPETFSQDLLLVPDESADRLAWCLRS